MNWPPSRKPDEPLRCHHSRILVMPADCVFPWSQIYDGKETYGPARTEVLTKFRKGEPDTTKSLWAADFTMDTLKITNPDQIDWEGFNGEGNNGRR